MRVWGEQLLKPLRLRFGNLRFVVQTALFQHSVQCLSCSKIKQTSPRVSQASTSLLTATLLSSSAAQILRNAPVITSESSSTSRRTSWHGTSSQEARLVAGCLPSSCTHIVTFALLLHLQGAATFLPRILGLEVHSLAEGVNSSIAQRFNPLSCADGPELHQSRTSAQPGWHAAPLLNTDSLSSEKGAVCLPT